MADPFEVRMRFTSLLQHLNASVTSAQKAAAYALKYRDMDEDLHSCILEQLEKNTMNSRANIMYFIEHLCDVARKEQHLEFLRMIQRDISKIVDAVAPVDGTGAANVKVLKKKEVLSSETVEGIERSLSSRDCIQAATVTSSPLKGTDIVSRTGKGAFGGRPDKRQIEQRIEEDRERHKRLREGIWAVSPADGAEFARLWDETSAVGEDDLAIAEEEAVERRTALRFE